MIITRFTSLKLVLVLVLVLWYTYGMISIFGMIGLWFSIPTLVYIMKVIYMALNIGKVYDEWCLSTQDGLVRQTYILSFQGFFY
jgi:hypothetical protein